MPRLDWLSVIPMQYTGLKDSSSPPKEIYEGDIFKVGEYEKKLNKVTRKYERKLRWHRVSIMPELSLDVLTMFDIADSRSILKVIGNIYENPELIKGDT